ncbi:HpcH/HpaI aldolase/citrate lyase family protein [Rhizobium helianthi]|uniref:HpcH/HpaI aldolase/citrate lyase family protein n=1 Tax=Rhizobium helianthi TaxID=1132695 RepID=A0ABW4M7Q3_9HYPH
MYDPTLPFQPLYRSLLSVPAINRRALEKAIALECDGVILDLEDSVAPEKKEEARDNLRHFFSEPRSQAQRIFIRINALTSEFAEDDMALVLALHPHGVVIPKVESVADLEKASSFLETARADLQIWAMMETARGILNAGLIAAAREGIAPRLSGFVVGLNDLRKETRVLPRSGRTYLVPWLMQVVLAARAHGLAVIDSVFNDFRDGETFEQECIQGREMGFDGKMLIHPAQIEPANRHFGPSEAEIAEARAIAAAFSKPENTHLNVINLDGRMIERLHLEEAEKLLAQLQQIETRKTSP